MNISNTVNVYHNGWFNHAVPLKKILSLVLVILGLTFAARAQDQVPPPMAAPTFSSAQLDQLLGPVALYPDPLLSVLLPASTLPSQIVMADRYVSGGGSPDQMDPQSFDPNVIALAHYPDVLKWMDDNLNWTTQLGEAFENQQPDVMDSVQRLRTDAYNLGNLRSTPQEQVVDDNGYIEIIPANPDDIYVPDYQPDQVYYDEPSGAPYITFSVGFAIGPWLCGDFDWWHHRMIFWDHDNPRPSGWWHERPDQRQTYFNNWHGNVWNPGNRGGFTTGYHGGDRGWNQPNNAAPVNRGGNNGHWTAPILSRPAPSRPAPAPTEHFQTDNRNDAFIGNQDARQTRDFSNRGAQSMGAEGHSFGGGGGFHGSTGGGGGSGGGFHSSGGGGGGGGGGESHGGGGGGGVGGRH